MSRREVIDLDESPSDAGWILSSQQQIDEEIRLSNTLAGGSKEQSFVPPKSAQNNTVHADSELLAWWRSKEQSFTPPESAQNNAKRVLKWRDEHPDEIRGMTRVGWTRASQLASGKPISLDTVKRMAQFARHLPNYEKQRQKPEAKAKPWTIPAIVAVYGWGGKSGISWAKRISERESSRSKESDMKEIVVLVNDGEQVDDKAVSYNAIQEDVRGAFFSQFPQRDGAVAVADDATAWPAEIWDEFVVVEQSGDYYRVPYVQSTDGTIMFASRPQWQPVEKIWVDSTVGSGLKTIRKEGGKWVLYNKAGTRKLGGPYDTREEAIEREREVQFFKRQKKELDVPDMLEGDINALESDVKKGGNIQHLISSWGKWAGSFANCVAALGNVPGINDPNALCAWMEHEATGKWPAEKKEHPYDALIEVSEDEKAKPEVTGNSIRIRVRNPGTFQEGSFRTITLDEDRGIKAVIGRPKGKTTTATQTYIFDKEKWTPAEAQKWVDEHKKGSKKARGQGQGAGGARQGDGGVSGCICPECGYKMAHEKGTPCNEQTCPECGAKMSGVTGAEMTTVSGNAGRALIASGAGQIESQTKDTITTRLLKGFTDLKSAVLELVGIESCDEVDTKEPGGRGSGYHGHTGRPGKVGGSSPGGISAQMGKISKRIGTIRRRLRKVEKGSEEYRKLEGEQRELEDEADSLMAQWYGKKSASDGPMTLPTSSIVRAFGDASEFGSSLISFKDHDGRDWLLTFTTNAFEDREGEIFATQSINDYVDRHEKSMADGKYSFSPKGEYQFWHLPGTKFGDVRWQGAVGRFLVEAGTYDDTEVGNAFKSFFERYPNGHPDLSPSGWGCSHKYEYKGEDREDSVYDWFEKSETTVLPLDAAANPYTAPLFISRSKTMNERQRKALELIGGKSLVEMVQEVGEKATAELEQNVAYKAKSGDYPSQLMSMADGMDDEDTKSRLQSIAKAMRKMPPWLKKPAEDEEEEEEKPKKPAKKKQVEEAPAEAAPAPVEATSETPAEAPAETATEGTPTEDAPAEETPAEEVTTGETATETTTETPADEKEYRDAVAESFTSMVAHFNEQIAGLNAEIKALKETVGQVARDDEAKIAEKAMLTPAASLLSTVQRAIGVKETRVDGRTAYAQDGPRMTPSDGGITPVPMLNMFMTNEDQKRA